MRAQSPQARSSRPRYPYFKVQVFDGRTMAWKDVQKRYNDERTAWAACGLGDRLMRVDRENYIVSFIDNDRPILIVLLEAFLYRL